MFGKLIFEFLIPAAIVALVIPPVVRAWYLKRYGNAIKTQKKVQAASERYDRMKDDQ